MHFIVTNKLILSTRVIFDGGFIHYYNFKIDNLPDGGEMRITEEKLLKFDDFLMQFKKPTKQAFEAFVKKGYFVEEVILKPLNLEKKPIQEKHLDAFVKMADWRN